MERSLNREIAKLLGAGRLCEECWDVDFCCDWRGGDWRGRLQLWARKTCKRRARSRTRTEIRRNFLSSPPSPQRHRSIASRISLRTGLGRLSLHHLVAYGRWANKYMD